jgi:hypothetical protein
MGRKGTAMQIVRYSGRSARATVEEGGRVQALSKGHAEVWDKNRNCVGYLTKADYAKYRSPSTTSTKGKA